MVPVRVPRPNALSGLQDPPRHLTALGGLRTTYFESATPAEECPDLLPVLHEKDDISSDYVRKMDVFSAPVGDQTAKQTLVARPTRLFQTSMPNHVKYEILSDNRTSPKKAGPSGASHCLEIQRLNPRHVSKNRHHEKHAVFDEERERRHKRKKKNIIFPFLQSLSRCCRGEKAGK